MKPPFQSLRQIRPLILAGLVMAGGLAACDSSHPSATQPPPLPPQEQQQQQRSQPFPSNPGPPAGGGSLRQRQADFLNRLRQADPQFKTIDRALLNDQNELGLILDRSVSMDDIPALMRTMLGQMAKEFPGQDLNVIAYAPSNPPMKIGTAHLDARTRDMTYTRENP